MSRPIMDDDGIHVHDRNGEFYRVSSTYTLPSREKTKDPWDALMVDVDELQNKPRRFFDRLLSLIEAQRESDALIDKGNRKEYWDYLIRGCEMWLSAVENGVYAEVIRLAEPLDEDGRKLRAEHLADDALLKSFEQEELEG